MIPFARILNYGNIAPEPNKPFPKRVQTAYGSAWYLHSNGDLYTTGANSLGQIGVGDVASITVWTKVLTGVYRMYGGVHGSIAIKTDGSIWYTGTTYGLPQIGTNVRVYTNVTNTFSSFGVTAADIKDIAIAEGMRVLLNNGKMFFVGTSTSGCFGMGTSDRLTNFTYSSIESIDTMACSFNTTVLVLTNGQSYIAGSVMQTGTTTSAVMTFTAHVNQVKYAACTYDTIYYFMRDSTIRVGARNLNGQAGNGTTTPVLNSVVISTVADITSDMMLTCNLTNTTGMSPIFISADGVIRRCGVNTYGQCGINVVSTTQTTFSPMILTNLTSDFVAIGGDNNYTLIVDAQDNMYTSGNVPLGGVAAYRIPTLLRADAMPWK